MPVGSTKTMKGTSQRSARGYCDTTHAWATEPKSVSFGICKHSGCDTKLFTAQARKSGVCRFHLGGMGK